MNIEYSVLEGEKKFHCIYVHVTYKIKLKVKAFILNYNLNIRHTVHMYVYALKNGVNSTI